MAIRLFSASLCTLLLTVCLASGGFARQAPRAAIQGVAWMEGTWVSASSGRTVEERWTSPAGGAMFAVSRTLRGERLATFEFLRIVERDGTLIYIAQPNGQPPTEFPLARLEADAVTFENPRHDFPKTIRYTRRADGSLDVSIGAGEKVISWRFEKGR